MSYNQVDADLDAHFEQSRLDTNRLYRDERNPNTTAAYQSKEKEWRVFCDRQFSRLPLERRYTMNEDKLHSWLKDDLLARKAKDSKGKERDDGNLLSYQTIYAYVAGAVNIWNQQVQDKINNYPHPAPRNGHVKKLLTVRSQSEVKRRRTEYIDRGRGTFLDTFQPEDLVRCNSHCLESGAHLKLRDRLALDLSFSLLLRGHSARNAELADFFSISLPQESTQPVTAVCMVIDVDKTNNTGAKQLMGSMRHLDYRVCTHNALAMYFFSRWHQQGENFPDLSQPKNWYDIKLLLPNSHQNDSGRRKAMSYTQHLAVVDNLFSACNIRSKAKTHAGRHSGAQHAEIHGVPELQIRRAGRWNSSVMENVYLSHLPRKFMRVAAGSAADDNSYFCPRSLVNPPDILVKQIFPQVDYWLVPENEAKLPDTAAAGFIRLLDYLRRILIQDLVFLQRDYPQHPLLNHTLVRCPEFVVFSSELIAATQQTPDPASSRLQQLAPILSSKLDELMMTAAQRETAAIAREQVRDEQMTRAIQHIESLVQSNAGRSETNVQHIAMAVSEIQQATVNLLARFVTEHGGEYTNFELFLTYLLT